MPSKSRSISIVKGKVVDKKKEIEHGIGGGSNESVGHQSGDSGFE